MSATTTVGAAPVPGVEREVPVWRRVAVGLAAALLAGAATGVLARLMMRLASLAAGHETGFSLAGTAGILIVFVVVAVPGAVLAALMRRRGRSALLVVGAVLLCVPAVGAAQGDLGALSGLSEIQWVGVGLATVGVFAAIIALPVLTLRLIALGLRRPR